MIVASEVIWRTASRLMECHGDDAVMEAALRANASRDVGNTDAYKVWLRVAEAVEEWFRGRQSNEPLH
jgi:hypothetical protein